MNISHNREMKDWIRDTLGKWMGFRVYKVKVFKNALKNPERFKDIITYALGKFCGQKDYDKFVILCRARTGSTPLQLMLNAHPAIHAKSEIFTRLYGSSVETIFNDIYAPHPKSIKAVGFKMFYNHPVDDPSKKAWDKLKNTSDLKVIHLMRKNILRSLVSESVARKTNVWGMKDESRRLDTNAKKVSFDAEELQQMLRREKQWEKTYRKMFQSHPMIDVYYEDLVKSPETELKRVTDFLGVPYIAPVIKLKKQNPESIPNLIENYADLKKHFAGTEWEAFFNDESLNP